MTWTTASRKTSTRVLVGVAATTLLATGLGGAQAVAPGVGSPGIGDPYFPRDGNGGYQVKKYDLDVDYRPGTRRLKGDALITARAKQQLKTFNLDLLLRASTVTVNGEPATFTQGKHELTVTPAEPLAAGDTMRVRVAYRGKPAKIRYRGERNFHETKDGALAVGEPGIAAWWFPVNDHPSDKARVELRLSVPKGLQGISNGALRSRRTQGRTTTWHWRSKEPMAPYLAFMAIGKYRIEKGRAKGYPYIYAFDRRLGKNELRRARTSLRYTPKATRFLEKRFGKYPYVHVGGVVTKGAPGYALENQTRPVYDATFFYGVNRWVVVHEMAHQWFGDAVAVKRWKHIWLNEGYATYAEWLWSQATGGLSANAQFRRAYRRPAESPFWDLKIGDPGKNRLFNGAVYERGAMTQHALRRKIGNQDYFKLSRRWVQRNRDGLGTQREYRALAEKVSGQELKKFFDKWIYSSSKPKA